MCKHSPSCCRSAPHMLYGWVGEFPLFPIGVSHRAFAVHYLELVTMGSSALASSNRDIYKCLTNDTEASESSIRCSFLHRPYPVRQKGTLDANTVAPRPRCCCPVSWDHTVIGCSAYDITKTISPAAVFDMHMKL
jgi:hypothetical protein